MIKTKANWKNKNLLINKVQSGEIGEHFSISGFLTKELNKDYSSISRLFPKWKALLLNSFYPAKVEKVKELLIYGENEPEWDQLPVRLQQRSPPVGAV